jgi:hypothetical protein
MKPYKHALASVRRWGGTVENYLPIHDLLDLPKSAHADIRHRAILHNSLGPYICERVFGTTLVNSDGRTVSVRDIAEEHILEDMGKIPSVSDYLNELPMLDWLGGPKRIVRRIDHEVVGEDATPIERRRD